MDWLLLIFNIFFTGYSLYAWRKYSDRESMWLGLLGLLVVFLLSARMFFLDVFPENIKSILDILRYGGWIFVLIALAYIQFGGKKNKQQKI